jgi:chorismate-pyruvate lyase
MSDTQDSATTDFDAQLAAVERFIADVQQGSVPTGEAMRAYRDVHRPAIERLRAQLAEFEALLAETGTAIAQAGDRSDPSSGSA